MKRQHGSLWVGMMLAAGLAIAGLFTGCRENPNDGATESIVSATDNSIAESEFANVFEFVDDEAVNSPAFGKSAGASELSPACAVVTVDTNQRKLTIDFGDENCLCKDGLYRRGTIVASFTGEYRQAGSSVTITLEDYYVQDMEIAGTKTLTRLSDSSWSVRVVGGMVTTPEGNTNTWNTERTVVRVEGNGTRTPWDDVYQYTGSADGVNRNGVKYAVEIDQPLVKKIQLGCLRTFVDGVLTISNENGDVMTVDYDPVGGAPCDKTAEVTINGNSRTVTLR